MSSPKPPILYVDDEKNNLIAFQAAFRRNYRIFTALSAREGMKILKQESIQVLLTDQRMPDITGVNFLKTVKPLYPDIVRIIVTGHSDVEAVISSINEGEVYRYISKPWNEQETKITIDNALEAYRLKQENKSLLTELQNSNENLEVCIQERTSELREAQQKLKEQYDDLSLNHRVLAQKNQMIDLLLRELNHRVLNNLQVVSVILNDEAETQNDDRFKDILTQIEDRVADLAYIHRALMYGLNRGQQTSLQDYFQEIAGTLKKLYPSGKEVILDINTNSIKLPQSQAYFLGFVLHELLSNAFKYAFEQIAGPKAIRINLREQENDFYVLEVWDNGVGFPTELTKEGNQINYGMSQSLGLKIIDLMAQLHEGCFNLQYPTDPNFEKGSAFQCQLRLSPSYEDSNN